MQSQLSVAISDFKNSINKLASHFPSEQPAFDAILEAVGGASKWSLPDDKRYISKDKRKLLAIQWSNNGENIDDDDYEAGFDCYAIGDLYNLPEGFDVSTLPKSNYELDRWDYSGPQPVYKGAGPRSQPHADALQVQRTPAIRGQGRRGHHGNSAGTVCRRMGSPPLRINLPNFKTGPQSRARFCYAGNTWPVLASNFRRFLNFFAICTTNRFALACDIGLVSILMTVFSPFGSRPPITNPSSGNLLIL